MRAPHHLLFRSSLVAALVAGCAPINVVVQDVTGFDARGASVGDVNAHADVNANTSVNANTAVNATANVGVPATGGAAPGPGVAAPADAPTSAPTPAPTPRAYTGTVTTIPMSGNDLRYIFGLNVDEAGNLYFLAGEQNVLHQRSPDGTLKAIATLGPFYITDMARDSKGNFFVTDWDSRSVKRVSPTGEISFLLGGNTTGTRGGTGAEANIGVPVSITIDAQDQMVVGNTTSFYAVTPAGEATFINGDPREKAEVAYGYQDGWERVLFNEPLDVTVDARGVLYVADTKNNIIRKIDRANQSVSGLAGGLKGVVPGFADGVGVKAQFNTPSSVAVDKAGYVYVADTENHRIRQIAPDGKVTTLAGATAGNQDGIGGAAKFDGPVAIAIGADGTLYVADSQRLCKIE